MEKNAYLKNIGEEYNKINTYLRERTNFYGNSLLITDDIMNETNSEALKNRKLRSSKKLRRIVSGNVNAQQSVCIHI